MRKKYIFGKKLYISVLTSILVLLTTVATTFAWVGVFANSTIETFNVNIFDSDLTEYNIEISTDGINFTSELSFSDVKDQILSNWGPDISYSYYDFLNQEQCTTVPNMNGDKIQSFGQFKNIYGEETSKFYKFNLYISCNKSFDSSSSTDFNLDVYLADGLFRGSIRERTLVNSFTYPSDFINPYFSMIDNNTITSPNYIEPITGGTKISTCRVSSEQVARMGFEKYEVVEKGHPELYTEASKPISSLIYQDAYEYPVYDSQSNIYSFGAILDDEDNLATGYYNSTEYQYAMHMLKSISLPDSIKNTRGVNGICPDLVLSSKTNHLIDSTNPDEQIGVNQMMKITCYFWFEGWDSDCFPVLNASPVFINLGFSMVNDVEF